MKKKAAFEMSISTIVIIVIAVVLLVLGLVFVRQIFGVGTRSVSQIDLQVRNQLQKMLGDEGKDITIYSKEVKVKPGTEFTTAFAARNPGGGSVTNLKYKVKLTRGNNDCVDKNGNIGDWFVIPARLETPQPFDSYDPDIAYGDIVLNIPKNAVLCSQRISVVLVHNNIEIAADAFTLHVLRGGLF
ncbi:MAG: hypothetical protein NZ889_02060 [Candidatus Pacearchaeota archaeon]|nr:hypothetical protein [Candidatus Pacearchaeota archaeon]